MLATCQYLESALDDARQGPPPVAALAGAFAAISPLLGWYRRPGAAEHGASFYDGHANTMFIGPKGLEQRSDVVIGASLLAPNVEYPQHSHPPEELYVVLNAGEWYSERADWYAPGIGQTVHHPPGITHAMRSSTAPLLAIWCLWVG